MFSPSVEVVLTVAYREASASRHTHLTLEHLLYALAHDPDGERILAACGADLPQLRARSRQVPRRSHRAVLARPAEGARADAGVPARPADGRAARAERRPAGSAVRRRARRDAPAVQVVRGAAARGAGRDAPRRAEYITHGISKVPPSSGGGASRTTGRGRRGRKRRARRQHRARSAVGLRDQPDRAARNGRPRSADRSRDRAAADARDSLPPAEEQSGVRRRRRRRQDRARRGSRARVSCRTTCRRSSKGAEVFSLDTTALLAGTRFRGDFEERFKAVDPRAGQAPHADSVHRRDPRDRRRRRHDRRHDGPRDADQAGADHRPAPRGRLDDARGVQAHREGPRARAAAAEDHHRRAVDRRDRAHPAGPSVAATRPITTCASPTTRSRRRPSWRRGICATTVCPTAPSTCSTRQARCCG